ncbi:ABC transporter ATP-binding protein [Arthrobacter cryoconiti]|uniref:ABC transporter ATP-binding protein n=1 Tax=Arthrobacter cryoconiti TaxID=748907 RepID=A0ABV8R2D2_9MICC
MSHRAVLPEPDGQLPFPHPLGMSPPTPALPLKPGRHDAGTSVRVENLTVRRGRMEVLKDLSFSIPSGHITALLGPSGSGKTTLIRTLVGVQKFVGGSIEVLGRPAGDATLRGEIGYVTQAVSVYKDLSVLENVRYFGAMSGCSHADAVAAVAAVGLAEISRRKAGALSGGQFSRVSLACALVSKPKLLVLDEPTVGLDPVLRADLWAQFTAMAAAGTTLLISSHVMEEAGHADTLLLLRGGRLLAQLTPAQLRQRGGSENLELAFLRLIQADMAVAS